MIRRPRPYSLPPRVAELDRPRLRAGRAARARSESRAKVTFAFLWGVLIRFLLVAGLVYLAYRARFVLVTVFMAALLALTLNPTVNALSRRPLWGLSRRAKRTIATGVVFIVVALVLFASYRLLISPFIADASRMLRSLQHEGARWRDYVASVQAFFQQLPPGAQAALKQMDIANLTQRATRFLSEVLASSAQWVIILIDLVLIPVLAFYFIAEGRGLKRELAGLVPVRYRKDALRISRSTGRILHDYVIANLVLCVIAGIVVYVALRILGVPYALSLSVLAGITRFVPVIGPIIGAMPILLLSLTQGPSVAAAVLIFFILLHLIESKVLLPELIGDRLNMHGALVLIVLLIGGEFAGIIGMFLAAPVAALIRVLLRTYLLHVRPRSGPHAGTKRPRPPARPARVPRRAVKPAPTVPTPVTPATAKADKA